MCSRRNSLLGCCCPSASGETSWHGYANQVLTLARLMESAIKIKADEVVPVPSSAFATAARRPLNSRLNTHLLQQVFGLTLPHWQVGVARMLAETEARGTPSCGQPHA